MCLCCVFWMLWIHNAWSLFQFNLQTFNLRVFTCQSRILLPETSHANEGQPDVWITGAFARFGELRELGRPLLVSKETGKMVQWIVYRFKSWTNTSFQQELQFQRTNKRHHVVLDSWILPIPARKWTVFFGRFLWPKISGTFQAKPPAMAPPVHPQSTRWWFQPYIEVRKPI